VGRSWWTRKGALEARGRQQADHGLTSVSPGAASKERLRVFEAETEVQERDRSRAFSRMLGAEPTALPLRAPGWTCSTLCQRRGRGQERRTFGTFSPRERPSGPSLKERRTFGTFSPRERPSGPFLNMAEATGPARKLQRSSDRRSRRSRSRLLTRRRRGLRTPPSEGRDRRSSIRTERGLRILLLVERDRRLLLEAISILGSRERPARGLRLCSKRQRSSDRVATGYSRRSEKEACRTFGSSWRPTRSRRAQPARSTDLRVCEQRRTPIFARAPRRDLRVETGRPSRDGNDAGRTSLRAPAWAR
jgi:hypothetical protein